MKLRHAWDWIKAKPVRTILVATTLLIVAAVATTLLIVALILAPSRMPAPAGTAGPDFTGDATASGAVTTSQVGDFTYFDDQVTGAQTGVSSPLFPGNRPSNFSLQTTVPVGSGRGESDGTSKHWGNGQEEWYSSVFQTDTTHPNPSATWELVDQLFGQTSSLAGCGPPALAIQLSTSGQILITVRGGAESSSSYNPPNQTSQAIPGVTNSGGVWHKVLMDVKWSTASGGYVKVYYASGTNHYPSTPSLTINQPNILTLDGNVCTNEATAGIYRGDTTTAQTVWHAGFVARSTEAAALTALGG